MTISYSKKEEGKLQFTFGKKMYNIDKTIKCDCKEKMGNGKDLFKNVFWALKLKKEFNNINSNNAPKEKINGKINIEINTSEEKIEDQRNLGTTMTEPNKEVKVELKKNLAPNIGLGNIGATCYMNATLQCFKHLRRLRHYLLYNFKVLRYNKHKKEISYALAEVIKNLWENPENIQYFEPKYFKEVISHLNPLFKGIAANDPKDLILFMLEKMHKELNIPRGKKNKK